MTEEIDAQAAVSLGTRSSLKLRFDRSTSHPLAVNKGCSEYASSTRRTPLLHQLTGELTPG